MRKRLEKISSIIYRHIGDNFRKNCKIKTIDLLKLVNDNRAPSIDISQISPILKKLEGKNLIKINEYSLVNNYPLNFIYI